jgi:hypothetical protein
MNAIQEIDKRRQAMRDWVALADEARAAGHALAAEAFDHEAMAAMQAVINALREFSVEVSAHLRATKCRGHV